MKHLLFGLLVILMAPSLIAQPSDEEIKKSVGGHLKNVQAFKFGKPAFTRHNTTTGNEEWLREVYITKAYDVPEFSSEQRGYAVYERLGPASYKFWKFLKTTQHLKGMADPTLDELKAMIAKDPPAFYGHYYGRMLKITMEPKYPEMPYQRWHTTKSVEVHLKVQFEYISSDVETELRDQVISIRLYRNGFSGPWDRFYAQYVDTEETKVIETKNFTPQQIQRLSRETLGGG